MQVRFYWLQNQGCGALHGSPSFAGCRNSWGRSGGMTPHVAPEKQGSCQLQGPSQQQLATATSFTAMSHCAEHIILHDMCGVSTYLHHFAKFLRRLTELALSMTGLHDSFVFACSPSVPSRSKSLPSEDFPARQLTFTSKIVPSVSIAILLPKPCLARYRRSRALFSWCYRERHL
jgi:hypothetical protein